MPTFWIKTNVKALKNPEGIHDRIVDLMIEMYQKDKKYMNTLIELGQDMRLGGSDAPCAVVNTGSLGLVDDEHNEKNSPKIAALLERELGVPADRYYAVFADPGPGMVGHHGTTFKVLYAAAAKAKK